MKARDWDRRILGAAEFWPLGTDKRPPCSSTKVSLGRVFWLTSLINREFDIDKVNLEFSVGLDTNQERGTASSSDNFIGEVGGFEDESKRSLKLLDNGLDELSEVETLVGLTVVNVFAEGRNDLSVGVGVENVTSLVQDVFELFVVGDDTIVDQAKLGDSVADVRVAVEGGWNTVRRPSCVGHRGLRDKDFAHIDLLSSIALGAGERVGDALGNVFSQSSDLADLLEENDGGSGRITVDSDTCVRQFKQYFRPR